MLKNIQVSISAQISKFRNAMADAVNVTQRTNNSIKNVNNSIRESFGAANVAQIEDIVSSIEGTERGIKDLSSEIIRLKKEQNKYFNGSKQYADIVNKVSQLNKELRSEEAALKRLNGELNQLNKNQDRVVGSKMRQVAADNSSAMEAMSRATTALTGTLLLLGDEIEGMKPAMKGLRVIMAGVNAVVSFQNLKLRENQQFTNLLAKAQNLYKNATTGATKATTLFKRALGVGLLITFAYRLLTISSAFKTIKDPAQKAEAAVKGFQGALQRNLSLYDLEIKKLEDLTDVEILKAQVAGKSEEYIKNIKIKSINEQLAALKKLEDRNKESRKAAMTALQTTPGAAATKLYNDTIQAQNRIDEFRAKLQKDLQTTQLNYQISVNDKLKKDDDKLTESLIKNKQKIAEQSLNIAKQSEINEVERNKFFLLQNAKSEEAKQQILIDSQKQILDIKEKFANEEFFLNGMTIDAANELNTTMAAINAERVELEGTKNQKLQDGRNKDTDDLIDYYDTLAKLTEEWHEEEFERINKGYDKQETAIKNQYANGILNAAQYNQAIKDLTIERLNAIRNAYLSFGLDVTEIDKQIADATVKTNTALKTTETVADKMSKAVESAFNGLANGLANALTEGITAVVSGQGGITDLFNGMLTAVANFLQQLGSGLIAAAIATQAFYETLVANPPAAIAFGIAAVAAGAAIKATLSEGVAFADGGIVSGPTLGLVGEYPGASTNPEVIAPLNKLKSMLNVDGQSGGYIAETKISGRDLAIVLNRYNNDAKRI